jgi:hypothetical protein
MHFSARVVITAVWRRIITRKSWLYFAIGLVSLAVLLVGAVQTEQILFRRGVERLVGSVRNMPFENPTAEQVRQLLRQWPAEVHTDGDCAQRCFQQIVLDSFAAKHGQFFGNHERLFWLYLLAGGHPARVVADFDLSAGIPQSVGVRFVLVCREDLPLTGNIYFNTRAQLGKHPDTYRLSQLHPTYRIYTSGGCEGCRDFSVSFLPGASQSDIDRLAQFDFSCLTRWLHPCRTRSDMMPAAWQQHLQELKLQN